MLENSCIIIYNRDHKCCCGVKRMAKQKTSGYILATVLMGILVGSALAAPTFSAFADKPKSDPPKNPPPVPPKSDDPPKGTHTGEDDDHKKGIKDPDSDKDKDNKTCKHPDTHENGKYRHDCDSDHDFK